jgi:hypothetical protein
LKPSESSLLLYLCCIQGNKKPDKLRGIGSYTCPVRHSFVSFSLAGLSENPDC